MNFFDEPDSPEGSGANESFFSQPSPVRAPAFAAARVSSVTGDTTASSFRDSSIFDRESNDRTIDRTRDESVSLEDILGTGMKESGTDVQELMRCWRNERAAPELLVFPLVLVNRLTLNLAKKVRFFVEIREQRFDVTMQKETVDRLNSVENQPESNYIKLSIAATENMRADFALKSFLRARLYKVRRLFLRYFSCTDRTTTIDRAIRSGAAGGRSRCSRTSVADGIQIMRDVRYAFLGRFLAS